MSQAPSKSKLSKQDQKSEIARAKLCEAMVSALDQFGYAEASIARVQAIAGLSRGALTHHFATKTLLIEATVDHLFSGAVRGARKLHVAMRKHIEAEDQAEDWTDFFKQYCRATWFRVMKTREGRALIEVLVAARTDAELRTQLEDRFIEWDEAMSQGVAEIFESPRGDADLRLVWGICRTFFRGLVLHERFLRDPELLPDFVERFAEILAPHLRPKGASSSEA